jgi:nucleoside-diphosphate-sugar epimerase
MANTVELLVTGADGFIGRRLTSALAALGRTFHGVSIGDGDIAHHELPFAGVKHVFHLAARMFVPESWENPKAFYQTNLLGAVNVLDFCRRSGAALTLVSSYVYGNPRQLPIAEDHPLEAFNPYGHTKILAEETARFFERHFRVRLVIVRPFNVYGPGQDERFLIPGLVRQALDPDTAEIRVADKRPKRDYVYIEDLVNLLLATLREDASGAYNAGSGRSYSIEDLVDIIGRVTGRRKTLVDSGQQRPQEVMDVIADIRRAEADLGWRPRVSMQQGIAEIVRSYQADRPL